MRFQYTSLKMHATATAFFLNIPKRKPSILWDQMIMTLVYAMYIYMPK